MVAIPDSDELQSTNGHINMQIKEKNRYVLSCHTFVKYLSSEYINSSLQESRVANELISHKSTNNNPFIRNKLNSRTKMILERLDMLVKEAELPILFKSNWSILFNIIAKPLQYVNHILIFI